MKRILIALPLLTALASPALAQGGPRFPVADVAEDLGISESDLKGCMKANRPSREEMKEMRQAFKNGQRPDGNRDPKPELISCLQGHNSSITADSFKEVMQSYRPEQS